MLDMTSPDFAPCGGTVVGTTFINMDSGGCFQSATVGWVYEQDVAVPAASYTNTTTFVNTIGSRYYNNYNRSADTNVW